MTAEEFESLIQTHCSPLPGAQPYAHEYKLSIKSQDEGKSLLDFYGEKFNRVSKENWEEKIASGEIFVNQKIGTSTQILKAGEITSRIEEHIIEPEVSTEISLIYLDENLIAVNKPSPLPSQPSGRFIKNSLSHILSMVFKDKKLFPIHRLDANTTGIILFAFDAESAKKINQQLQNHEIIKTYHCIVNGIFEEKTSINDRINITKKSSGSRAIGEGKNAITEIKILNYLKDKTLLQVTPQTGRTNQIRLHLANIGFPILGDLGYENSDYFKSNPLTYSSDSLFLHAYRLKFKHPKTNEWLQLEAPIPKKFDKIINQK